jgi:hypothetical protein
MSQTRYLGPTAHHCPTPNHQELNAAMSNPRPAGGVSSAGEMFRKRRQREWIPVAARFSAPVQTGPMAHPASCTMGTESFPGVKRPECGVDHPPPPSSEGKERVELYQCSPLGL